MSYEVKEMFKLNSCFMKEFFVNVNYYSFFRQTSHHLLFLWLGLPEGALVGNLWAVCLAGFVEVFDYYP